MMYKSKGFTLIEIAIVLVIIGLLLGGVLKGQELITGARVRNLISQQDGIKAAFFGFQDRYRALPGDYAAAAPTSTAVAQQRQRQRAHREQRDHAVRRHRLRARGNPGLEPSDRGRLPEWQLCHQRVRYRPRRPGTEQHSEESLQRLRPDRSMTASTARRRGSNPAKHNLKTGGQVPVEIIAEVDRKIDDGKPNSGGFQFSEYTPNSQRSR